MYLLSSSGPLPAAFSGTFMSSGLIDDTIIIFFLALVIATLSLFSPPAEFKGPKFMVNFPFSSLP
ncbi:hypothetical protein SE19_03555 [Acidiplasma aeolicum]|uniref:Uncharacterized protein n=1 Tax=Acidiplasma aeolicum TaxID=507754 RepID=A0A0Q0XK28_9ARCH|nr:hypothetical protein TZ01_08900 [Acidiplasma sp. MBA-1]KPV46876.1 hypothetical protein SE19_03555 [Acidiplasma aeolicum]KQB35373.1 hypothetical protein AOG54_03115 [Acidiplasma aeolicum]